MKAPRGSRTLPDRIRIPWLPFLLATLVAGACGPARTVSRPCAPDIWKDNDNMAIPMPAEDEEGDFIVWDGTQGMLFHPLEKLLDMGGAEQTLGQRIGWAEPEEAQNINAFDEVPDSTWFTNRQGRRSMSLDELRRGPNLTEGPDTGGDIEIIAGKGLGLSPGFLMEDSKGDRYLIKFDPREYPELATATEMIAAVFMYASGYNVPEYHIVRLDPNRLKIRQGALVKGKYNAKRAMTPEDLDAVLSRVARNEDGTYRAIASKLLAGTPIGPPPTQGVRKDDPNDTVRHEDRRELRGMQVISSFLNNTDSRRGNYLDMYVGQDPEGHVEHYFLDFSASMGSGNTSHKEAKYGHEYVFDPQVIFMSLLSLGLWVKHWEGPPTAEFPSVGTFHSEHYEPQRWKTSYQNPLFNRRTARDAFWAAKILASFTDEQIRTIVDTGRLTNPAAADYVARVFIDRRDKVAHALFDTGQINPLDDFRVLQEGRPPRLQWEDLGVSRAGADPVSTRYRYRMAAFPPEKEHSSGVGPWRMVAVPEIDLEETAVHSMRAEKGTLFGIILQTSRDQGRSWSPSLNVFLEPDPTSTRLRVVALER